MQWLKTIMLAVVFFVVAGSLALVLAAVFRSNPLVISAPTAMFALQVASVFAEELVRSIMILWNRSLSAVHWVVMGLVVGYAERSFLVAELLDGGDSAVELAAGSLVVANSLALHSANGLLIWVGFQKERLYSLAAVLIAISLHLSLNLAAAATGYLGLTAAYSLRSVTLLACLIFIAVCWRLRSTTHRAGQSAV